MSLPTLIWAQSFPHIVPSLRQSLKSSCVRSAKVSGSARKAGTEDASITFLWARGTICNFWKLCPRSASAASIRKSSLSPETWACFPETAFVTTVTASQSSAGGIPGYVDLLSLPPGNRLEALSGDRAGQHSIRINDRYRICFIWNGSEAVEIEVTDYH